MVAIGRIASSVGHLLFNPKFQETASQTLKASKKAQGWSRMHVQIGDAFKAANNATKNTSFWSEMRTSATSLPRDISSTWKNTSGFWNKTKGVFGQLGKRMPLIGGALMVAFELPNLFSAFKDKGLVGGLLETGKSTARLCGFMGGMAIGQALIPIPIVGGIIGGIAGDWLISKIVGKSHSEKKQEQQEALAQATQQEAAAQQLLMQNPNIFNSSNYAQNGITNQFAQPTITPQQLMQMEMMLRSGYGLNNNSMDQDFMATTSGINRLNYTV